MNQKYLAKGLEIFGRSLLYVIGIYVLYECYQQYRYAGWDWGSWDIMYVSGLLAFILALYFARGIPDRMSQTIDRLARRCTLAISDDQLSLLKAKIERRARRFAIIGAAVVGFLLFAAIFAAFGNRIIYRVQLLLVETFLGAVAGYYIGQMVAYGFLGQLIQKERIPVEAKPGHIDNAAGLKPIGDYYFYQAMIIAIPCIYIAVWWFIIPLLPHYSVWRNPYLGLLAVALVLEILSFLVPMEVFHEIMQKQKIKYLSEADGLSENIVELENRLLTTSDSTVVGDTQKQLDFLRAKYWEIEQMPTWPVDAQTRRRFTVNNILLLLPFVSDVIKTSSPWKKLIDLVVKFLTS